MIIMLQIVVIFTSLFAEIYYILGPICSFCHVAWLFGNFSNLATFAVILLFDLYFQGKKLLVMGTTSEVGFLDSVGICDSFSVTYHVPTLKADDAKKVKNSFCVLVFISLADWYCFPIHCVN